MTKNISTAMLAAVALCLSVFADEQAAVVVDKDGKVKALAVQPGPVTVDELKKSYHEVGGADPDFVPPPPAIPEPAEPAVVKAPEAAPSSPEAAGPAAPAESCHEKVFVLDFDAPPPVAIEPKGALAEPPLPQPLFEPNQNNAIVLPGRSRASSDEGIANPFDIRLLGFKAIHEVKIRVGGVVMSGDRPTAIVNGKPCSANDRWSGFNVVAIRRDAVLLERDGAFVLIPRGREISIRIPL